MRRVRPFVPPPSWRLLLVSVAIASVHLLKCFSLAPGLLAAPAHAKPWASQLTAETSSAAQRDPQAVGILAQAVSAAGGATVLSTIRDFTATGQGTYFWPGGPYQGTVTVKGKGQGQFRVDATLPDGVHSWIVNSGNILQKNPDGGTAPLPAQNLAKPATITLPILHILLLLQDNSWSISSLGLVSQNGQLAQDICVQKVFPSGSDAGTARSHFTKTDFFIDPNSFAVLRVKDFAHSRTNDRGEVPHEMQFSAYQSVGGILVPFSITELIDGQETATMLLTQVTFNSGLTDLDFEP